MKSKILTFLTALAMASAVFADNDKLAVDQLIQKAVASTDVLRPGVPHTIRATFELSNLKDKPKGQYERVFASRSRWVEVIRLDKYGEATIVKDGQMRKTRPEPYDLEPIRALHEALDPLQSFEGTPNRQIDSTSRKKVDGKQTLCAKYKQEMPLIEICADPASGHLVRTHHNNFEVILSDYTQFGEKFVPKSVTVKSQDKIVAKVTIESISQASDSAASVEPPATASMATYCAGSQFSIPTAIKAGKVRPHYPEEARQSHQEGTVILAVVINADGTVRPVAVVQSVGKALDEESWRAVSQWRYQPATCDGKPMDWEETISVNYQLTH